jgi:hypothetical protein
VETLELNGEPRPLVVTGAFYWRYVVFDRPEVASIHPMSGAPEFYGVRLGKSTLVLKSFRDAAWSADLTYTSVRRRSRVGLLRLSCCGL